MVYLVRMCFSESTGSTANMVTEILPASCRLPVRIISRQRITYKIWASNTMVEKAGTSLIIFTHDVHPHSLRSYHTSYEHSIPNLHPNVFNPTPLSLSRLVHHPTEPSQGFARQCRAEPASCRPAGNITGYILGWILTGQLEEAPNCCFCCWRVGSPWWQAAPIWARSVITNRGCSPASRMISFIALCLVVNYVVVVYMPPPPMFTTGSSRGVLTNCVDYTHSQVPGTLHPYTSSVSTVFNQVTAWSLACWEAVHILRHTCRGWLKDDTKMTEWRGSHKRWQMIRMKTRQAEEEKIIILL